MTVQSEGLFSTTVTHNTEVVEMRSVDTYEVSDWGSKSASILGHDVDTEAVVRRTDP